MTTTDPNTKGLFSDEELLALKQLQEDNSLEQPTPAELIAYCEKYVSGLKKELAKGHGEDWMHNSIRLEEAIITHLKNIPASEINGSKGCDEVSPLKPLFKSRADRPLQNTNAESDGRDGSHPSRCCGRCDGVNDICVADVICDDHKTIGCEICFGPRTIVND